MPYPRELLNDDEEIIFDRHPHWSYMIGPISMIALGVLVTIVISIVSWQYAWIGVLIIALFCLGSFGRYLRWRTTQFVLTSARIIIRQGILSKHGLEIPLDRVMNISYHQTIWERLLKVGDLVIESAGESGRQVFTDVAQPALVQNLIYKTAEQDEQQSFGNSVDGLGGNIGPNRGPRVGKGLSIPEQIEKLAELHRNGVLSDEEFRQSKQQLLEDL
jgi:membrane protein YdbS with pleckstrin-like domain